MIFLQIRWILHRWEIHGSKREKFLWSPFCGFQPSPWKGMTWFNVFQWLFLFPVSIWKTFFLNNKTWALKQNKRLHTKKTTHQISISMSLSDSFFYQPGAVCTGPKFLRERFVGIFRGPWWRERGSRKHGSFGAHCSGVLRCSRILAGKVGPIAVSSFASTVGWRRKLLPSNRAKRH